jgi:2-deoxy-D-gluconate 3-dehydrogenase
VGEAFAGKRVLVTGTSRGIGRAIAERLAVEGAEIGSLQRGGGVGLMRSVDLADPEQTECATEEVVGELGGVDICVYAAGTARRAPVVDLTLADWRRVLDVNLTSAFVVTRCVGRDMMRRGEGGVIIHVASELAMFGGVNGAPYAASKGGLVQLMRSQSNEWAPEGIRVNAVSPGYVSTAMTEDLRADSVKAGEIGRRIPIGRWGEVSEVADTVAWLASESARYVTGANIVVDGGFSVR